MSVYFNERFGEDWCLSSEQSLAIYSGNMSVPKQLLVKSPKSQNNIIQLLHGTSFFDMAASIPSKEEIIKKDGIKMVVC